MQEILFFSIPFDKGWKAKVDGKETELIIANIGFTGLLLDKGVHQIELSFTPRLYYLGAIISCIALVLFIMLLLGKLYFDQKTKTD